MSLTGLLNMLLICAMCVRSIRGRQLASIYWLASLVFGGLPLLLPGIVELEEIPGYEFHAGTAETAAEVSLLFNLFFAGAYEFTRRVVRLRAELMLPGQMSSQEVHLLGRLALPTAATYWCAFVALFALNVSSLSDITERRFGDSAEAYEGKTQYGLLLGTAAITIGSTVMPIGYLLGRARLWVPAALAALGLSIVLGSRTYMLAGILPILVLYLFSWLRPGRTLSWQIRRLIGILALTLAAYMGIRFVALTRTLPSLGDLATNPLQSAQAMAEEFTIKADPSAGAYFYTIQNGGSVNFETGETYWEVVLLPFPRALLSQIGIEDARTSRTIVNKLAEELYGTEQVARFGSIHPTIWGDAYANFGFAGVFLGLLWGPGLALGEKLVMQNKYLTLFALPALCSAVAVSVRGSILFAMFNLYYSGLLLGVSWVMVRALTRDDANEIYKR